MSDESEKIIDGIDGNSDPQQRLMWIGEYLSANELIPVASVVAVVLVGLTMTFGICFVRRYLRTRKRMKDRIDCAVCGDEIHIDGSTKLPKEMVHTSTMRGWGQKTFVHAYCKKG